MLNDILQHLRDRDPLPPLTPRQVWDAGLSQRLQNAADEDLFGTTARDAAMVHLCRAGLLLWNDDLEASHTIAQRYEGQQTADFWHAIMHRREGDASNARYWWHRVGAHPAFQDVQRAVLNVLGTEKPPLAVEFAATLEGAGTWLPAEFTGLCDRASEDDLWLRRVQVAETETLLAWCLTRI